MEGEKKKKYLRIAAQMLRLRDDMEDLGIQGKLMDRTKMWIAESNRGLDKMFAMGGKVVQEEIVRQAMELDRIMKIEIYEDGEEQ